MIEVTLTRRELRVVGHAKRGKRQADRVCAAVSVLMATLKLYYDKGAVEHHEDSWTFPRWTSPEFEFVINGLIRLAGRYPKNIKFRMSEHERAHVS